MSKCTKPFVGFVGIKNIFSAEVHEPPIVNKGVSERRVLFINQDETLENLYDVNGSWEANEDARHNVMANFTFKFENLQDMLLFQEKVDAINVRVNMSVIHSVKNTLKSNYLEKIPNGVEVNINVFCNDGGNIPFMSSRTYIKFCKRMLSFFIFIFDVLYKGETVSRKFAKFSTLTLF